MTLVRQRVCLVTNGAELDLIIEELPDGRWLTYADHSLQGRGASETHPVLRAAKRAVEALEARALADGWQRKTVTRNVYRTPSPMRRAEDGTRLFRDAFTGDYRPDLSCTRPATVPNQ